MPQWNSSRASLFMGMLLVCGCNSLPNGLVPTPPAPIPNPNNPPTMAPSAPIGAQQVGVIYSVPSADVVDIKGGTTTAVHQGASGAKSQRWQTKALGNGQFALVNADSSMCLSVGTTDVTVATCDSMAMQQQWSFTPLPADAYQIVNVAANKVLTATDDAALTVAPAAAMPTQAWAIRLINAHGDPLLPAFPNDGNRAVVWPNAQSKANSDPWLLAHHNAITQLQPHVLVLNFENGRTTDAVTEFATSLAVGFAEGSRYHGYLDANAPVMLRYQLAKVVNLVDPTAAAGCPNPQGGNTDCSSTFAPRRHTDPTDANSDLEWDYAALFTQKFADYYGIADPNQPWRNLTLCQLFESGQVNEVWINDFGAPGKPAEILSRAPVYDANRTPTGAFTNCAGNGCFDDDAAAGNCAVTVRIGELAMGRGVGCGLHAFGHAIESLSNPGTNGYFSKLSQRFLNAGLKQRHNAAIDSPYDLVYNPNPACKSHPYPPSIVFDSNTQITGYAQGGTDPCGTQFTMSNVWDGCGDFHYAPNSTYNYDYERDDAGDANGRRIPVPNTCEGYGLGAGGQDAQTLYTYAKAATWDEAGFGDCGGGWEVYLRQSMPGLGNKAHTDQGEPMLTWWPFLFY